MPPSHGHKRAMRLCRLHSACPSAPALLTELPRCSLALAPYNTPYATVWSGLGRASRPQLRGYREESALASRLTCSAHILAVKPMFEVKSW